MEKVKEITQEQLQELETKKNKVKIFKELIGTTLNGKYEVGDTMLKVENSKKLDIFKNTWKDKDTYYIVVNVVDEQQAFVYSLYPVF